MPVPSLFAIGISPRSTVDRCILQFNQPQLTTQTEIVNSKIVTKTDPNVIKNGGILETEFRLAVGAPLIGQLNGPIVVRADSAHWFQDTYNLLSSTSVKLPPPPPTFNTFGTALGIADPSLAGEPPIWIDPELRLLLYLTSRGTLPPHARAPSRFMFVVAPYFVGAPPGPVLLLRAIPVMGRKHITVTLYADNTSAQSTFFMTGIATGNVGGGGGGIFENNEIDLGLPSVIVSGGGAAGESAVYNFTNSAPAISWLLLYGQFTDVAGFTRVAVTVEAID
jgi:hypothetical protein